MYSCGYIVYSPSRFSYMGWTPGDRLQKLRPCHTKQVFGNREEAEELARCVGDGVVQKHEPDFAQVRKANSKPVDVDVTYW